ncbi:MAG: glycosyltransferase family 9 protein [Deltaproteobacteria bacterium]|nr:glycosyltransferase family 9 protein [Deltaproteobacteria bacterium]
MKDSNFLIIKYSSLGDIINSIPAVRILRKARPDSRIHWLIKEPFAGLLKYSDFLDSVIVYGKGGGLAGTMDALGAIRKLGITTVFDLQGLLKSSLIGYFSGAKERVSLPNTREGSFLFHTRKLGIPRKTKGVHAVEENAAVIEDYAGLKRGSAQYDFSFTIPAEAAARATGLIGAGSGPVVAVSPTTRWKSKLFQPKKFAEVADRLTKECGARIFFTGTKGDIEYVNATIAFMQMPCVSLAGKTDLITLAAVLKASNLLLSCDSGTMHLGSAVGTPLVAVFGPTDPSYIGPYSKKSKAITASIECAPCRKRECEPLKCMDAVSVDEVFTSAREMLTLKSS